MGSPSSSAAMLTSLSPVSQAPHRATAHATRPMSAPPEESVFEFEPRSQPTNESLPSSDLVTPDPPLSRSRSYVDPSRSQPARLPHSSGRVSGAASKSSSTDLERARKRLAQDAEVLQGKSKAKWPAVKSAPAQVKTEGPFAVYPVDWSLKTTLRVTSTAPLEWCTTAAGSAAEAHGVARFVAASYNATTDPSSAVVDDTAAAPSAASAFQSSLQYWAYPEASVAPALVTAMQDASDKQPVRRTPLEAGLAAMQTTRIERWLDAYRSLYHMLRHGLCPYFYVDSARFTLLTMRGRAGDFVAFASTSTRGLRNNLSQQSVPFTMPLKKTSSTTATTEKTTLSTTEQTGNGGDDGDEDYPLTQPIDDDDAADVQDAKIANEIKEDLAELTAASSNGRVVAGTAKYRIDRNDGGADSLLQFTGASAIHALYDFMVTYRELREGAELPTILAPCPFANATLKHLRVRQHGTVAISARDTSLGSGKHHINNNSTSTDHGTDDNSAALRHRFGIQIDGPIMPHCVSRIHHAVMRGQPKSDGFSATITLDNRTQVFNRAIQQYESASRADSASIGIEYDMNNSTGAMGCIVGSECVNDGIHVSVLQLEDRSNVKL